MTVTMYVWGLVLTQTVGMVMTACDLKAAAACLSDVNMLNGGIAKVPDAESLKSMCGTLNEIKACFDPHIPVCRADLVFNLSLGVAMKSLSYLCIEGYQDILNYTDCWNKTEVAEGTTRCHRAEKFKVNVLKQQVPNISQQEQHLRLCQTLKESRTCKSNVVFEHCGQAPSCLMKRLVDRETEGITGVMKCPETENCTLPNLVKERNVVTNITTTTITATSTMTPNGKAASRCPSVSTIVLMLLVWMAYK